MKKILVLFILVGLLGTIFAYAGSKMEITINEIKPGIMMQPMNCHPSDDGPFRFIIKLGFNSEYEEDVDVYYSVYDMKTGTWVEKGLLLVVNAGSIEHKQMEFNFYAGGKGNGTITTPAFELWYEDPENHGLTVRKTINITTQHWETTNEIMVKKSIAEIEEIVSEIESKGCDASEIRNNITEMENLMAICECPSASIIGAKAKSNAEALLSGCVPPTHEEEEEEEEVVITPPEEEQPPQPPVEAQPPAEEPQKEEEAQQQPGMCPSAFVLAALGVAIARWEY